ncbi:VRR-NUC domain-containing protein [Umbelopsis sp. AD052]|nr:VRR-NUC domain-containing protein [Umbelopsis sp. AD052]
MRKRNSQPVLQEKGNKKKKAISENSQRTLESFFQKRQFPEETSACASPIEGDDHNATDSTTRTLEVIPDDNESDLLLLETLVKSNPIDYLESQSNSSVPGSSVVDAISPDEIQPFFATSMYTDEFDKIMQTVLENEKYLFTEEELQIAEKHRVLHIEAKHLFVRIFLRKHKWIRLRKTDYSRNIADINNARSILCSPQIKFARDETELVDLAHLLNILLVDELKALIQNSRIPIPRGSAQNRCSLINDILDFANGKQRPSPLKDNSQRLLGFEQKTKDEGFAEKEAQERVQLLVSDVKTLIGPCIILEETVRTLFEKIHFVYYRASSQSNVSAMTAAILVRTSRRTFPSYIVCRSNNFWPHRDDLLEYYEAVKVYQGFKDMIEDLYSNRRNERAQSAEQWRCKEVEVLTIAWLQCESILENWKVIIKKQEVKVTSDDDWDRARLYFRKRFEAGWVYTHMIEDGAEVLGRLHEYEKEVLILKTLLDQNVYRLGKRGAWFDRLALVQMNHLRSGNRRIHLKAALETCTKAIRDPKVHLVYMSSLQRRIMRLESMLNVPKREQHDFFYNRLTTATERIIYGERLSDAVVGVKSVFRNNDGGECSVEELALGYYNKNGYKGFHSENGIIKTMFGLLFWDILFTPFPDVLETPFQTAPLDLPTDAFFIGRSYEIYTRLREISNGKGLEILKTVYDRESKAKTWCIGVTWDYELDDLLQITECIGANALSQICKVFAEEYDHRTGGMPDLCCWNYEKKECLFVEVKGPGDFLSETQKVWIDLLINSGVRVELCHIKIWDGEDELLDQ